jgi:hypothetical protein
VDVICPTKIAKFTIYQFTLIDVKEAHVGAEMVSVGVSRLRAQTYLASVPVRAAMSPPEGKQCGVHIRYQE